MTCGTCGRPVAEGARFCSACGQRIWAGQSGFAVSDAYGGRLVRPRDGRMIAGVCAGFAVRYGWDPALVRLVLVLAVVLGAGSPLIAYLVAWIVMPNAPHALPQTTGVTAS